MYRADIYEMDESEFIDLCVEYDEDDLVEDIVYSRDIDSENLDDEIRNATYEVDWPEVRDMLNCIPDGDDGYYYRKDGLYFEIVEAEEWGDIKNRFVERLENNGYEFDDDDDNGIGEYNEGWRDLGATNNSLSNCSSEQEAYKFTPFSDSDILNLVSESQDE